MRARVFNIMQYRNHPVSGEALLDEDGIAKALEHRSIKQWAWVAHDRDVYSEVDEQDGRMPVDRHAGDVKPLHYHVVCRCDSAIELDMLARWFGVPSQYVDVPKGRGAFLDCVQYLTHESERQRELGKVPYGDDKVHANFDWRGELLARDARRAKYGGDLSPKDAQRYDVLVKGKSLRQCLTDDPMLYAADLDKLKKLRLEYLANAPMPKTRQNFYVCGGGGVGKDLLSRALARNLFPGLDDEDCFFVVGADEVSLLGYDAQPVIIWSDCRASDLLRKLHGRGNVFATFDTNPTRVRQHVKFGSVTPNNVINIVNSPQDYRSFLDELVSTGDDDGEDRNQSYRRFPFIIPMRIEDFDFLVNRGYMYDTDDYTEYIEYRQIRGSFANVARRLGDSQTAREIEARLLEIPVDKALEARERYEQDVVYELTDEFADYGMVGQVPLFELPSGGVDVSSV